MSLRRPSARAVARAVPSAVVAGLLAATLAACGSDDTGEGPEPSDGTPTAAAPTEPADAEPHELGESVSVGWDVPGDSGTEIELSVEEVREGDVDDFAGLTAEGFDQQGTPYYVDVRVRNEGETDLGEEPLPLYLRIDLGTLSPAWEFAEPFEPCASTPLPSPFGPDEEAELCLVYVAPRDAEFEAMVFQPSTDAPSASWTGEVTTLKQQRAAREKAQKKAQKKAQDKKGSAKPSRRPPHKKRG